MEPAGELLGLQQAAIGPEPEPDGSSPHRPILFL